MREVWIDEKQVRQMVIDTAKNLEKKILDADIFLAASDSYGPTNHRTWAFTIETDLAIGTIEKYWEGLKMICSTLKAKPRTYFFTVEGVKCGSRDLKKNSRKEEE